MTQLLLFMRLLLNVHVVSTCLSGLVPFNSAYRGTRASGGEQDVLLSKRNETAVGRLPLEYFN
jgi:hypothetical protein